MSKFVCSNTKCERLGKEVIIQKVRWKFDRTYMTMTHGVRCDECGDMMEYIDEKKEGDINVYFGKFAAKSPEQKKEILKKRAHNHNMTKMKDRIPEVRKRLLGQ